MIINSCQLKGAECFHFTFHANISPLVPLVIQESLDISLFHTLGRYPPPGEENLRGSRCAGKERNSGLSSCWSPKPGAVSTFQQNLLQNTTAFSGVSKFMSRRAKFLFKIIISVLCCFLETTTKYTLAAGGLACP